MPEHKHSGKRSKRPWYSRWLPSVDVKVKWEGRKPERAPSDYKFLTMEDIKAARSNLEQSPGDIPETGNTPGNAASAARPKVPKPLKKQRSFSQKVWSSIAGEKYSRGKHRSHNSGHSHTLRTQDGQNSQDSAKRALQEAPAHQNSVPPLPGQSLEAHHHHHHHSHSSKRGWWSFGKKHRHSHSQSGPGIPQPVKIKVPLSAYHLPVIHSTALFITAYLTAWFACQFAMSLVATLRGFDSVLYSYEVMFPMAELSAKLTPSDKVFISLAGPLGVLLLGSLCFFLFLRHRHPGPQFRMFLLWLCLHSLTMFFGAFIGGAVTSRGSGYVTDWLSLNMFFLVLLSILFFSLIGNICWRVVRFLPETAGPGSYKYSRAGFILSRLTIPWILGSIFLFIFKNTFITAHDEHIASYDAINLGMLAFSVIPPLYNGTTHPHKGYHRKPYRRIGIKPVLYGILLALSLTLLVKFGLKNGIHFQMVAKIGTYN